MTESPVELYIYDLSNGMASIISPMLIGKKIDGIWHTSIVAYGKEYFFGSRGVEGCDPGTTALRQPLQKVKLGDTQVPYTVFIDYLAGLSQSTYAPSTYQLFTHNCNNFSEEIAQFLCGRSIPRYILDLPNEALQSNLGPAIQSLVQQLEKSAHPVEEEQAASHKRQAREASPDYVQLNSRIEEERYNRFILEERRKTQAEKFARRQKRREKKLKKLRKQASSLESAEEEMAETEALNGAETQLPSDQAMALEEEERREEEERKKAREPPVVYKDAVDVKSEYEALAGLLEGKLSPEEQKSLDELKQYMIGDEGSWALGDSFLSFIEKLLNDGGLPKDVKARTLKILAAAALKDDVILLLHQDRKDHILMNYAYDIDRHTTDEQIGIALLFVNLFENLSSSEWLMYISEWTYNNQQISNIRVTTKVAVHSLLSDLAVLQEYGAAVVHNLACKEVFDDVAVELTMALLQFFNSKPSEELLFRCLKALAKFTQISGQEVPQLIQMIGPDPKTFKGTSERVDQLIDQISVKLR